MDNNNIKSEQIVIENFQNSKGSIEISESAKAAPTIAQDLSITEKIPRPRNAFILFRQHHHKILIDEWNRQGEEIPHNSKISKILGLKWKSLNDEERIYWEDMARKEKIEHEKKYPNYRYKPVRKHKKKQSKLFMEHTMYDNLARQHAEATGNSRNITPPSLVSLAPTPTTSATPAFYRRLAIPRTDSLVGNYISSSPANVQGGGDEEKWKQVRPPQPPQQHFTNSTDIPSSLSNQYAPVPFQLHRQNSNPPMQSNPGMNISQANTAMPFPFMDKTSNSSKPNAYSYSPFARQPNYPPVTKPLLASISPPQQGLSPVPSSSSVPASAPVSVPRTQSGAQPSVSSPNPTILYPSNLQVQHQMHVQMQQQMQMQMELQMQFQLQQQMQFQHQLQMQSSKTVDNHLPTVNFPQGQPEQVNEFAYQSSHSFFQPYSQPSALTRPDALHGAIHGSVRGSMGTTKEISLQPIAEYQQMDTNSSERDIREISNENDEENND